MAAENWAAKAQHTGCRSHTRACTHLTSCQVCTPCSLAGRKVRPALLPLTEMKRALGSERMVTLLLNMSGLPIPYLRVK
jgi:hypothetical protein